MPANYYSPVNRNGVRSDLSQVKSINLEFYVIFKFQRPELRDSSIEIEAPAEYMVIFDNFELLL